MDASLPDLPILDALDALRTALADAGTAILVAPPGAGKTTVVPLALVEEPWLDGRRIVMLEPRRLATRAAAMRMAATSGTRVGDLIGYQTRDERHIGARTRIEVVTEGILTRRLQSDPDLPGVGLVVFDEVHERNLPTDLGLALALDVRDSIRPDLRLLAMSATPDIAGLTRILDAPVIESEGRTFDVDVRWVPSAPVRGGVPRGGRRPGGRGRGGSQAGQRLEESVASAVRRALRDEPGDVLVFLPGIGEIRRVESSLAGTLGDVDVLALAGALPQQDQDRALAASPPGRRRVVLATDIAETSLTVEGVRVVVDAGLAREPRFDPRTGMTRLTTVAASRASADQRSGRAGRTEPGTAYRLWSQIEHAGRPRHRSPEIVHADVAGLALELAAWGTPDGDLRFIDPPPPAAIAQARSLLYELHGLDDAGVITPLGHTMLGLPVHPRLARMIAIERSPLACIVATLIDERDILRGRPDELPRDLALRVGIVVGRASHDAVDRGAVRRVRERAADLARRSGLSFDLDDVDPERTGAVTLLAYPDRLAARRRPGQFVTRAGGGASVPASDPLANEAFIVAADLDGRRDRALVRLAAGVDDADIRSAFGTDIVEDRTLTWDSDRERFIERVERRLGAIALGRHEARPEPSDDLTAALVAQIRATRLDLLPWTAPAVALRERVAFVHRTHAGPWPDWSVDGLIASIDEWLMPFVAGATGRDDLARIDLATVLRSHLPWPLGADLDTLAPPTLELPSGRSVTIDYSADQPDASVRVQDLFGIRVHPSAAGVAIRLHLLSPADRPIQVTADLPGFWAGSWAAVRKEMAGRYPKHQWPTDPANAEPKRLKDR